MKTKIQTIFTVLALVGTIKAQSINVTPTGVGIGTATPAQKLDVAGNIAATGNITSAGNVTATGNVTVGGTLTSTGGVGIGTATPGSLLDIKGTASNTASMRIVNNNGNAWSFWNDLSGNGFNLQYNGSSKLVVTSTGNVGIGTTTPTAPLEVAGDVVAKAQVFRGYMTANFSKAAGWEKLPFNAVAFNTLTGVFDAANGRFTPSRSGYYQVTVNGFTYAASAVGDRYGFALVKNGGTESISGGQYNVGDTAFSPFSGIVYLNGIGDVIEIWMYSAIAATLQSGSAGYGMQWHMSYLGK